MSVLPGTGETTPTTSARAARRACALLAAASAAAVYAGSLRNGFVYDDLPQVVANPWIRDPRSFLQVFLSGAWDFSGQASNYYRPVTYVLWAAEYALFGLGPAGFHAVNVALHAAVSALVFSTTAALLGPGSRTRTLAIPAAAALLFATHPIHTEAVSWVSGLTDVSITLFLLGALHLYAGTPGERAPSFSPRYVLSVALFLLATLTKETALVFPVILGAHDVAFRRDERIRARLRRWLPYLCVVAVYLALRTNALGSAAPVRRHEELTAYQAVINAFPLLASYLWKLVAPTGLSVFHAFHPITSLLQPEGIAGVLVATGVVAGGAALLARGHRRALLALVAVLVPLAPVLYAPVLGENPFAERYLYLPSVGFAWLLALAADRACALRPRVARGLAAAAGVACAAGAVAVVERQRVWRSEVALWEDASIKSPDAAVAHYNLAVALQAEGRVAGAASEFLRAVRIQPAAVACAGLGSAYLELGRAADAVEAFRCALALEPAHEPARNGLGVAYLQLGRVPEAVEELRAALAMAPNDSAAHENLGVAYERMGMRDAALQSYAAAVRADPENLGARERLRALSGR